MTGSLRDLTRTSFPRLVAVRWSSQASDGLFQSGLASFLLFSPERAPNALAIATGFAVVLLPYSLIGPFVGTVLDRFFRRDVVAGANIIRALLLAVIAGVVASSASEAVLIPLVLVSFGLSRLLLAGLSAGLPRLVGAEVLVTANAIAVTGGTVAAVIGGAMGFAVRTITSSWNDATSDASIVTLAALFYGVAALTALLLRRDQLGPAEHEREHSRAVNILEVGFHDVRHGLAHLAHHPQASFAILRIAFVRGGMSALIVATILLQRNVFTTNVDAGLAGLALTVSLMGAGALLGAAVTPWATTRFSRQQWMHINTAVLAVLALAFAVIHNQLTVLLIMMKIAAAAQAIKVSADAEVQTEVSDEFRGRVFAVYDMSVNVAIVLGAIVAAMVLPFERGLLLLPCAVGIGWALSALHAFYAFLRSHQSSKS